MKRIRQEKTAFVCPICGKVGFIEHRGRERTTCSRECSLVLNEQIRHPERYDASDMTPYALAQAFVYWRRKQTRGVKPTGRQYINLSAAAT